MYWISSFSDKRDQRVENVQRTFSAFWKCCLKFHPEERKIPQLSHNHNAWYGNVKRNFEKSGKMGKGGQNLRGLSL